MIRILHLADLHLGWSPQFVGEREPARRAERDRLLERAADFALSPRSGIGLVVLAGDIFETHRPEPALVAGVMHQLRRLETAGIGVVTVPGNHDEITYHDSVYRQKAGEWPGLLVQNPMPACAGTISVAGVPCHIYSLAYTGGLTRTVPPISDFPRLDRPGKHVGIFHGSLDWDAGERSLPLQSAALARAAYDYIALGHLHLHSVREVGRGKAVYPGAIEGKAFTDPGVGFYTVAEIGDSITVRQVPAGIRPIRSTDLDAGSYSSSDELAAAIRAMGESTIQRVRLVGNPDFPLDPAEILETTRDRFYHLELVDETEFLSLRAMEQWATEPTIRGQFLRRMRSALEQESDEGRRRIIERALRLGLTALRGGPQKPGRSGRR